MSLLLPSWLPECSPERIIVHWTGGSHEVSGLDKEHYHFIVDGKGKVYRGNHSIQQNMSYARGKYAAHTYGLNTNSIGVSAACMGGAGVSRNNAGPFPLTKVQWNTLVKVVAELCKFYHLEPTEKQVLQHGDVHRVYGIDQWGKWDINFLPWDPNMSHEEVGHTFRRLVRAQLQKGNTDVDYDNLGVTVTLNGKKVGDGVLEDGKTFLPVREISEALGLTVNWDPKTRTVELRDK